MCPFGFAGESSERIRLPRHPSTFRDIVQADFVRGCHISGPADVLIDVSHGGRVDGGYGGYCATIKSLYVPDTRKPQ